MAIMTSRQNRLKSKMREIENEIASSIFQPASHCNAAKMAALPGAAFTSIEACLAAVSSYVGLNLGS
jgi:hypothetical protein